MHSDRELLSHINEELLFIQTETAKTTKDAFLKNETLKRAYTRSLEVIGEAVKNLGHELVIKNPDIPWRNMAGMRDRLIHGYFSVDYEIVWDVAKNKVPEIRRVILTLLEAVE
jgi:uncharacterized protein with HEPN domain